MARAYRRQRRPLPDDLTGRVLRALMLPAPIEWPTVVVIAHPDDETLAMAGRLATFERLTIVQLTDGAPSDGIDANRLGFTDPVSYSAERENETQRALAVLGLDCPRLCLGVVDQQSVFRISELVQAVEVSLGGATLVFTHSYEGGHPDHDTAAFVVQWACARMAAAGRHPPSRFEFASYHHRDGQMTTGQFWPEADQPEIAVVLDGQAHALKRRALAEYGTQSDVIRGFCTAIERYRTAPHYDFSGPPPPGLAQYDLFGWSITAARWRARAVSSLHLLQETRS